MADILLLLGVALCVLSLIAAIAAVIRTQPPRSGAIMFLLGILLIFAGAWIEPGGFTVQDIPQAWRNVSP